MLQEDMKKALRSERRTPPAGFEERSDTQILRLTAETKPGRRMPRAAVVLCVLLAIMSLATALAATVDSINARLHAFWPEAAEFLMPVDASCEREGIRLKVLSAVVKDGKALVTYSLQDLEGDRLNEYSSPSFSGLAFPARASGEENTIPVEKVMPLSYDAETRTGLYAQEFDYDPALVGEDYEIPLHIQYLFVQKQEIKDLHPLLEEYGGEPAAAQAPEGSLPMLGNNPASRTVMDLSGNLRIRLNDYVELSGIGWIDGQLHVRIHYLPEAMRTDENGAAYSPVFCYIHMMGTDGISPWFRENDRMDSVNFGWQWNDNGSWFFNWEEYIFPCTPGEAEEGTLRAVTVFQEETEAVEGNWFVKVPLRMIRYENAEK